MTTIEVFVGTGIGAGAYSFNFFSQSGYLDHGLASASMVSQATGAAFWHVNTDEPSGLDYNNSNQPGLYTSDEFRSSDHDPVVIGLEFDLPTCNGLVPTIVGTAGDDTIVGTNQSDVIMSFGGNDTFAAGNSDDVICAGSGDDVVEGGNGQDIIFGQAGDDTLLGDNGKDVLDGGAGTDTADGGNGNDTCTDLETGVSCEF